MCDGRTEIDTTSVKIHAAELAKQINHEYQSQGGSNHVMAVLALDVTPANRVAPVKVLPSAILFLGISREGVFQHPLAISPMDQAMSESVCT
jgi:hypothetical protein